MEHLSTTWVKQWSSTYDTTYDEQYYDPYIQAARRGDPAALEAVTKWKNFGKESQ
jgi:hypothetical protein